MFRRPPGSTRTCNLCPDTTLFRSAADCRRREAAGVAIVRASRRLLRSLLSMRYFLSATKILPHPEERDRARTRARVSKDAGRICSFRCARSEEHTSELQSLMRISYAVFCLKKQKKKCHHKNKIEETAHQHT